MNQEEASNLGILNNSYFSLESAHGNPAYDEVSFDGLSSNHSVPLNIKSETSDEPLTLRKDEQWENFQYFKTTHPQWKNVVRHALSFCRWFKKIQYQGNKRLNYWTIDPLLTHRIKSKVSKVLKKKSVAEKWLTHPEKFDDIKRGSLLRKYEPFSAPLVNLVETYPTIMQKVKLPQHLQKA
ncbi:forkhead box protein N1-like isoform X2 [Artemia franciscana]|uniref:forkhead box protein N1-like isoform X2 n=1 Tax=Artemia franciscana TaxID=6661 RepID=UPI0032DAB1A2